MLSPFLSSSMESPRDRVQRLLWGCHLLVLPPPPHPLLTTLSARLPLDNLLLDAFPSTLPSGVTLPFFANRGQHSKPSNSAHSTTLFPHQFCAASAHAASLAPKEPASLSLVGASR